MNAGTPIYPNSPTNYGVVGDGVHDDAPNFMNFFLGEYAKGAPLIIPGGTYAIGQPIPIPNNCYIKGFAGAENGGGTSEVYFKALAGFNTAYNPNSIAPCMFQTFSYADDPSGLHKWTPPVRQAGVRISGIDCDCNNVAGLNGWGFHNLDEHCIIEDCKAENGVNGFLLTGSHTGSEFRHISAWLNSSAGVMITSHSFYNPGQCAGNYCFVHISGDQNNPGLLVIQSQAANITVMHMKQEVPPNINCNAITFQKDPLSSGSPATSVFKNELTVNGGNFAGLVTGITQATAVIGIKSTYQAPSIYFKGWVGNYKYIIQDTIGVYSPANGLGQYGPIYYCTDITGLLEIQTGLRLGERALNDLINQLKSKGYLRL